KTGLGRNLLHVRSIPLGADLDGVAAVAPAIEDFKQRTRTRAEVQAAAPRGPLEAAYAGAGACVNCHTQEFARWGFSGHARAWQSLVKRKATDNPECVGCHSTAYGEAGGLGELTPANIRKYRDVQCEACHGPLGGHPDDDRVESLEVTAERCVGCHDAANSPDFEFASYLREASCQPYEVHAGAQEP
ncbi:MAG: cytochrome c family protein, partial [Myxococcota bacterium]|nr:cytochrome c family protein [Myxococcota bacterium]